MSEINVKEAVRSKYSQAALRVSSQAGSCCGTSAARDRSFPITSNLYNDAQTAALPEAAVLASLGCGNPTALAQLAARRDRPRPRLGRWHRRAALSASGRPQREGLWS